MSGVNRSAAGLRAGRNVARFDRAGAAAVIGARRPCALPKASATPRSSLSCASTRSGIVAHTAEVVYETGRGSARGNNSGGAEWCRSVTGWKSFRQQMSCWRQVGSQYAVPGADERRTASGGRAEGRER